MPYIGIDLKDSITVGKLYSIHYFEYMSDFKFPGESHDFWEFVCVDKGDVAVTGGDRHIILNRGEVAFHQPGEFHDVQGHRPQRPQPGGRPPSSATAPPWNFSVERSCRWMRRSGTCWRIS